MNILIKSFQQAGGNAAWVLTHNADAFAFVGIGDNMGRLSSPTRKGAIELAKRLADKGGFSSISYEYWYKGKRQIKLV